MMAHTGLLLLLLLLSMDMDLVLARERCSATGGGVQKCIAHCAVIGGSKICTCPPDYATWDSKVCVKGTTFQFKGCRDGTRCGFHGTCEDGVCFCDEYFLANGVGVCGKDHVPVVAGLCDEISTSNCPLQAKCDSYGCKCLPGTVKVLDRCIESSFPQPRCSSHNCPPPAHCDATLKKCTCSLGRFAWGKSCVTRSFTTKGLCGPVNCRNKAQGSCVGNSTCMCGNGRFADGQDCARPSFRVGDCITGAKCGVNGVCLVLYGDPFCFCHPGFAERQDFPGKCIPGSAMPYSSEFCKQTEVPCKNGVCRSATGDSENLRCYCTFGKRKDGTCKSRPTSRRHAFAHKFLPLYHRHHRHREQ